MTLFQTNGEIKLDESTHKYILEGHEEIDKIKIFNISGVPC